MDITQQYAELILHAAFQASFLLKEIQISLPGSSQRKKAEKRLAILRSALKEEIEKAQSEIVEAFRKNKAAQLILELK